MTYALDTNIISYILRRDKYIVRRVSKARWDGHKIVIPLMVYYEIKRGLTALDSHKRLAAFVDLCSEFEVINLNTRDMNTAAEIYAENRRAGRPIEDNDLIIAATCVTNGYTLVTNNIKHFQGIENLQLENWIK